MISMEKYLLLFTCILNLFVFALIFLIRNQSKSESSKLTEQIQSLKNSIEKIEVNFREDFRANREEFQNISRDNRTELSQYIRDFTQDQKSIFSAFQFDQKNQDSKTELQLEKISVNTESKLKILVDQIKFDSNQMRTEIGNSFAGFQLSFDKNVESFNSATRKVFAFRGPTARDDSGH